MAKSQDKAVNYFKNYLEKAPDGRFALNSIEEIVKLDKTLTNYDNLLIAKGYYFNVEFEKSKKYLEKVKMHMDQEKSK